MEKYHVPKSLSCVNSDDLNVQDSNELDNNITNTTVKEDISVVQNIWYERVFNDAFSYDNTR